MDRYTLITGATSGIGAAFARLLASQGEALIIHGRREDRLRELCRELLDRGAGAVEVVLGDLSERNVVDDLVHQARHNKIRGLINNAGFGTDGSFLEQDMGVHRAMVEVHSLVPMELIHRLLPTIEDQDDGYIINVSSMAANLPIPGNAVYCSSKMLLSQFTRALHLEKASKNLRIMALEPGFTHTDFHGRLDNFVMETKSKGLIRWMNADTVAKKAMGALRRGRASFIPGWPNRFLLGLSKMMPWASYKAVSKRASAGQL